MINPKLQKLRELNEARTKGEWIFKHEYTEKWVDILVDGKWTNRVVAYNPNPMTEIKGNSENMQFIAALANNAEWLIGCVEALEYIRDMDFRGNRHASADVAFDALAAKEA